MIVVEWSIINQINGYYSPIKALYIHIPFCNSNKCDYCDFYSITTADSNTKHNYIKTLKKEWELINQNNDLRFSNDLTVYIGGGTPNLFTNNELEKLLENIKYITRSTQSKNIEEISIENNPENIGINQLEIMKHYGINRLSLGIQSFNEIMRKRIGRYVNNDSINNALDIIKSKWNYKFNIDMIIGLPNQSEDDMINDLKKAISYNPHHLSIYILTPERNTKLWDNIKNGKIKLPSDESISKLYQSMIDFLKDNNFNQYEVSNFAKTENDICKHNMNYWQSENYIGLGASAVSTYLGKRMTNVHDTFEYMDNINSNKLATISIDDLDDINKIWLETLYLRLRTQKGIKLNICEKFLNEISNNNSKKYSEMFWLKIDKYSKEKYIEIENEYIFLTKKGFMVLDNIVTELSL